MKNVVGFLVGALIVLAIIVGCLATIAVLAALPIDPNQKRTLIVAAVFVTCILLAMVKICSRPQPTYAQEPLEHE